MAYIHFNISDSKVRLYPMPCLHIGAPQSDMQFIKEHVERIKDDPDARWVYMGDGGECVTTLSKGDVYGQLVPPQLQIEILLDTLEPIRNKGLFGIRGNHGHRIYKETGLSFDHTLCSRLGLPYMGVGTFADFSLWSQKGSYSFGTYWHHGTDSGTSIRSKIAAAEKFGTFVDADAIFTAHSHVAIELQPSLLRGSDSRTRKETTKIRHQYICGSAYDSRTGYAEDKGYPPLIPSFLSVELRLRRVRRAKTDFVTKEQSSQRYESDGQHELKHEYIQDYLLRRVE